MRGRLITFTSLFPSAAFPQHGLFVAERMRRVAALSGLSWVVVAPVPVVPRGLRRGDYARWAAMPASETVDGVEVWHPRYRHWPGFSTARQARRILAAARPVVRKLLEPTVPAVLDAHYVYPDGVAALWLARELALPAVVTARGSDLNVLAGMASVARQIRRTAPLAFARLAVSEPLRRRFVEVARVPHDAVLVARNGVDLRRFAPGDAAAARRELGLPAHGALMLGVGRLVRSKGFHRAVEVLATVPDVTLVLVGDGPERARLEAAAPPGRLRCLGALPPAGVARAYQACDVLVLPSDREGWPNVVTEALASGLPVVASAVGSVPELLADRCAGEAVLVGDIGALRRAIRRVLAAGPDRAAVRAWAERFSWDAPVAMITDLLRAALGMRGPR